MIPKLQLRVVLAAALLSLVPLPAASEPPPRSVDVLVEQLREQGVIDQQTADEVLAAGDADALRELVEALQAQGVLDTEHATEVLAADTIEREQASVLESLELWGDFRNRFKGVWFDKDPAGDKHGSRTRAQLRLRLRGAAEINEYFDMQVGVTTVNNNERGRRKNIDWGKPANGAPDEAVFDQIFSTIHLFGREPLPWGLGRIEVTLGKFNPPYRSEVGRDLLVWDPTLTLDGVDVEWLYSPTSNLEIKTQGSYFQFEVASEPPNPRMFAIQIVPTWQVTDWLALSVAPTAYFYGKVSNEENKFREDGEKFGNIPEGLTNDDSINIAEMRATATITAIDGWPLVFYGRYLRNFSAEANDMYNAGKEDEAFSVGMSIGDPDEWFEIGGGFMRLEANAVPAQFPAFEPFDGHTNLDVWSTHISRTVFTNMLIEVEWYRRKARDRNITFVNAVEDSDSHRINAGITMFF
jgi:hypothetical protein